VVERRSFSDKERKLAVESQAAAETGDRAAHENLIEPVRSGSVTPTPTEIERRQCSDTLSCVEHSDDNA
jgi:hypothetical protein